MDDDVQSPDDSNVDKSLVAMFLAMSPEERLRANDNAVRAILELRHAYKQRQSSWLGKIFPKFPDLLVLRPALFRLPGFDGQSACVDFGD